MNRIVADQEQSASNIFCEIFGYNFRQLTFLEQVQYLKKLVVNTENNGVRQYFSLQQQACMQNRDDESHFLYVDTSQENIEIEKISDPYQINSFIEYLKVYLRLLNTRLLPVHIQQTLLKQAQSIADCFVYNRMCIEVLLAAEKQDCDFFVMLTQNKPLILNDTSKSDPVWQYIAKMANMPRTDGAETFYAYPESIEIDIESSCESSEPSIFFRFTKPINLNTEKLRNIIDRELALNIDDNTFSTLCRIASVVPAHAYFEQIGVMFGRKHAPIKVVIFDLAIADIASMLLQLDMLVPLDIIQMTVQEEYCEFALSLDIIQGEISPKIGVEIAIHANPNYSYRDLLQSLATAQLICEMKADCLLSSENILICKSMSFYVTHINHIKITFEQAKIAVKGYLALISSNCLIR